MAEPITLTQLLKDSRDAKELLNNSIKLFNEGISELNIAVKEADILISEEKDGDNKYQLMQYKSNILQIKADYIRQLEETEKNLNELKGVIRLVEKAIQLNTGDIF